MRAHFGYILCLTTISTTTNTTVATATATGSKNDIIKIVGTLNCGLVGLGSADDGNDERFFFFGALSHCPNAFTLEELVVETLG